MRSCLTSVLLLVPAMAFAQEPPPPAVEPASVPGVQSLLPNLLSTAPGGTVDARLDYTHDNAGSDDLTLFGLTLHGQYLTPQGYGGYVSAPFSYASGNGDSRSGLGNLEVGGLYALRTSETMDVLLRGGIALDTADDDGTLLVPISQISPRLTDAFTTGFNTTWGRAQAQVRTSSGTLRLGALGGVDVPISGDLKDAGAFDALLDIAVSAGIEEPGFGIGVGFSMIQVIGDDSSSDDDNISSFNATIDFPVGPKARVFGTLGIPDLDNISDNGADLFAIGTGVRVGI